jgi:hypothetical protein
LAQEGAARRFRAVTATGTSQKPNAGISKRRIVDPQDGQPTSIYRCGRYAFISQQPGADFMPAFGAGCCMSVFNENRERVIRLLVQGDEGAFEVLRPNLAGYSGPK